MITHRSSPFITPVSAENKRTNAITEDKLCYDVLNSNSLNKHKHNFFFTLSFFFPSFSSVWYIATTGENLLHNDHG